MANKNQRVQPVKAQKKSKKGIIIVSAILLFALVAGVCFGIWLANRNKTINFLKADLSRYITMTEDDYKNYTIAVPYEVVTDEAIARERDKLLVQNKNKTPYDNGAAYRSIPISLGDVVTLWYRGYTVDENGKEVDFAGGTSLTGAGTQLEIGSGSFIPGFEQSLIGIIPSEHKSITDVRVTTGTVQAGDIIYLSYSVMKASGATETQSNVRIDLSSPDVDATYGTGFVDYFIGKTTDEGTTEAKGIGKSLASEKFFIGDSTVSTVYYDMKVDYVLRGEEDPITIDVRFPADYSETSLRGVNAKFDVYVQSAIIYDVPEYNDEFVTKTLGFTAEKLQSYAGNTLTEKHMSYLRAEYEKAVKKINLTVREEAMWAHYKSVVVLNELPEGDVKQLYDSYYAQTEQAYEAYKEQYETIDDFAVAYYGLNTGVDWREYLNYMASDAILEKLIFYYVLREADLFPSEEEYQSRYDAMYNEYLQYYIDLNYEALSKYQGAAYDAEIEKLEEEMMEYYGEEYFRESVYYDYGTEKMIEFGLS